MATYKLLSIWKSFLCFYQIVSFHILKMLLVVFSSSKIFGILTEVLNINFGCPVVDWRIFFAYLLVNFVVNTQLHIEGRDFEPIKYKNAIFMMWQDDKAVYTAVIFGMDVIFERSKITLCIVIKSLKSIMLIGPISVRISFARTECARIATWVTLHGHQNIVYF